jgi:hypothetical protein
MRPRQRLSGNNFLSLLRIKGAEFYCRAFFLFLLLPLAVAHFELERGISKNVAKVLRSGLKTQANRTKAFSLNADQADQADFYDYFFRNNPFHRLNPPAPRSKNYFFEFSNSF